MSVPPVIETLPPAGAIPVAPRGLSPGRRAWQRFRSNRLGYVSLVIFVVLFGLSLIAEVLSNDNPLLVRYEGRWYVPVVQALPETVLAATFRRRPIFLIPIYAKISPSRAISRSIRRIIITTRRSIISPKIRIPRGRTPKICSAPTTRAATCWRASYTGFASRSCSR